MEPRHMRRQGKKEVLKLVYYRSLFTSAGSQMCHLAPATISNHMNFTTALKFSSQIALYCAPKTLPVFEVTCRFPTGVIIQMKSHHGDTSTIKS